MRRRPREALRRANDDSAGARLRAAVAKSDPCRSSASTRTALCWRSVPGFALCTCRAPALRTPSTSRPRHHQSQRRLRRRAPHRRRDRAAAARRRRHRLGRGFQHCAHDAELIRAGAGGHAPGGPGPGEALRSSSRQGAGRRRRDGRSHQGRRRRPERRFLRDHGAHRRARRRRAGCRDRTRTALRRGRRRHDLRRGARDARRVPSVHEAVTCRCSRTSPSSARHRCSPCRSSRRSGRSRALSLVRVPRHEPRGGGGLRDAIRSARTQKAAVDAMQTRAELYEVLGYHEYERKLDDLFGRQS